MDSINSSDVVDVRSETIAHIEREIEKEIGITEVSHVLPYTERDDYKPYIDEYYTTQNQKETREKIGVWFGVGLSNVLLFFKNKIKIDDEQAQNLGGAWGAVCGKWLPESFLKNTEKTGDFAEGFSIELEAGKVTFSVFGDRILKKITEKNPESFNNFEKNSEIQTIDNTNENTENSVNFPKTEGEQL